MNINTDIDILLAKYFSGEASAKELSTLEDWLAQSEENQAYFDEMTAVFEKSAQATPPRPADTEKAWSIIERHMQGNSSEQNSYSTGRRAKIPSYMQVAAVALILIATSVFFFLQKDSPSVYIVANEETIQHTLPDSSIVVLSRNSSISYDKSYGEENKLIALTGKASFNISDSSKDKLTIRAGETFIKDIGTEFTVDSYTDNSYISVSVVSGIVLFYTADNDGISIYEDETGYYDKAGKQFSKQVGGRTVEHNHIVFDATPLNKVAERLSRQFNVSIVIKDNSIMTRQITVSFNSNDGIENILRIVAETLRLNLQYQNGKYLLSPI